MALYGLKLDFDASVFPHPRDLEERLVASVLKRSDERKVFLQFLNTNTASGRKLFDCLVDQAEKEAAEGENEPSQDSVASFVLSELKARKNGHLNLHDHLVFASIEGLEPRFREHQLKFSEGKITATEMPEGYPSLRNKAEGLLKAKIRDGADEKTQAAYLTRENLTRKLREVSREMFFAINKLGLEGEDLQRYLRVVYQADKLSIAQTERSGIFKEMLGRAIKNGETLNLIAIKCLRFTYPYGNRLKLIATMGTEGVPKKDGSIHYPLNEENYFDYLCGFMNALQQERVPVEATVLVADLDLDDYFPDGKGHLVPGKDIEIARQDVLTYSENVKVASNRSAQVVLISEHLKVNGLFERYEKIRDEVMRDLLQNKRNYLPENIVETRVNYRYDSNFRIFGIQDRPFARQRVCAQLASLFALQVLAGEMTFLLAEDKGLENKLIGGREKDGLPVVFVKLRDEA